MGMAAVKYFDLKQNRTGDYSFQYEKMLDPKGNTAVYLMYSYVRMCSVLRKAQIENVRIRFNLRCKHSPKSTSIRSIILTRDTSLPL